MRHPLTLATSQMDTQTNDPLINLVVEHAREHGGRTEVHLASSIMCELVLRLRTYQRLRNAIYEKDLKESDELFVILKDLSRSRTHALKLLNAVCDLGHPPVDGPVGKGEDNDVTQTQDLVEFAVKVSIEQVS